jgi:hypothetical protein
MHDDYPIFNSKEGSSHTHYTTHHFFLAHKIRSTNDQYDPPSRGDSTQVDLLEEERERERERETHTTQ